MKTPFSMRRLAGAAALLCVFAAGAASAQSRATPEAASGFTPKPLARAEKHMIVAAHPLASEAGLRVLRDGGSAIDAAIAAQLVLNVVEPQSSGIGGGGFALHWSAARNALSAWDGRETAPAGAKPYQFLNADGAPLPFIEAATSGLAIGAPGAPRLLERLHREGGVLPWARLFEDAVRLADQGFPVSPRLHGLLSFMAPRLKADPAARAVFFTQDGAPLAVGAVLRQPELADSLRMIAAGGATAFYKGPLARRIVAAAQADPRPGALSLEDLAGYRTARREPACGRFRRRYRVCGMPPPSSGGVTVAQILGLMDHVSPQAGPIERAHFFLEASRLAYADRDRYLADPDHVAQPVAGLLEDGYLTLRAQRIDPNRAGEGVAPPGLPRWSGPLPAVSGPGEDRPGTTHITVVDGSGNILAMTSSIETAFGSGRMAGGFFLNNQLTDFSFRPLIEGRPVANALAPGKRPRSSMAPTIILDQRRAGRPVLALGSPGGSRIIEYVAAATLALLDEGLDPASAAARPHLSQRNKGKAVVETGADADALAERLTALGHEVLRAEMTSGLHIVQIQSDGALLGGADPRREGVALGD